MRHDCQRVSFKSIAHTVIPAFDCTIKAAHMPADCNNFVTCELDEALQDDDRFLAMTKRETIFRFVERLLMPCARNIILDVPRADGVVVHLRQIVEQRSDRHRLR